MNKLQFKGRAAQARGMIKEVAGRLTGNRTLEHDGWVEKHLGRTRAAYGDLQNDIERSAKQLSGS